MTAILIMTAVLIIIDIAKTISITISPAIN